MWVKAKILTALTAAIVFIATIAPCANACATGMYEEEIPECLR